MASPDRAETIDAPPVVPVCVPVDAEPVAVWEAAPETGAVELAVVGVKGAVIPNPGSLEAGTEAANAAKVLSPVVGGLMAPYIPPWQ